MIPAKEFFKNNLVECGQVYVIEDDNDTYMVSKLSASEWVLSSLTNGNRWDEYGSREDIEQQLLANPCSWNEEEPSQWWYYGTIKEYVANSGKIEYPKKNKTEESTEEPKEEEQVMKNTKTVNSKQILFAKTKKGAIVPSKREEDGAFDIYACFEEDYMVIKPHETKLIPTGIASAFSSDYVAILKERGSTGTKGIGQRAGVIDSGFRGEWFVPLTNHNDKTLIISKDPKCSEVAIVYPYNKAIAQCMMVEVPKLSINEIFYDELLAYESERGVGSLGSSGK